MPDSNDDVRRRLSQIISIRFDVATLGVIIDYIRSVTGTNIAVNWTSLELVGVSEETFITLTLRNVPAVQVLKIVLEHASAENVHDDKSGFIIRDGIVHIATRSELKASGLQRFSAQASLGGEAYRDAESPEKLLEHVISAREELLTIGTSNSRAREAIRLHGLLHNQALRICAARPGLTLPPAQTLDAEHDLVEGLGRWCLGDTPADSPSGTASQGPSPAAELQPLRLPPSGLQNPGMKPHSPSLTASDLQAERVTPMSSSNRVLRKETQPAPSMQPGPDYLTFRWGERRFSFSKGNQAQSVRVLWEAWANGGHMVNEETIGDRIGSQASRFRLADVFRRGNKWHLAWGTLIVSPQKGCYSLDNPPA